MTEEPEPPDLEARLEARARGTRSLKRTVIAIVPLLVAHAVLIFGPEQPRNFRENFCMILIAAGAVLAATLVILAVRRSGKKVHPALQVVIFLAVLIAYGTFGFVSGCFVALMTSTI